MKQDRPCVQITPSLPPDPRGPAVSTITDGQAEEQAAISIYPVLVFGDCRKHCPVEIDRNGAFQVFVSLLPQ